MESKNKQISTPIKVTIIDDDESHRDYLKAILKKDQRIELFSEFESAYAFLKEFKEVINIDVCLVDVYLGDMSGIELAKMIKKHSPLTHIIIITAYPDLSNFSEAFIQLEADYIEKGTGAELILDKIIARSHQPSMEEQFLSLKKITQEAKKYFFLFASELEGIQLRVDKLSKVQRKVLQLRKGGRSIDDIAKQLKISASTVRTHINRGLKKLGLPNILKYIDLD